ncbi:MAG: hypothetical protein COB59_00080 [Rhodospirillaceae bacterium]|nr:MAG: hypothetical protein COB59_00080 [Rhodospirillaceae bacterium]
MWIKVKGLNNPIAFDGVPNLVKILDKVLRGWTFQDIKKGKGTPLIRLKAGARGYERRSPWIKGGDAIVFPDPVDAVCDLLLDLEHAYIKDSHNLLALHAAGAKIGSNLVVFPSTHGAGKSLLTAALAQSGHRVFADDQLPILPGSPTIAVAPGFLPRLRNPLPDDLDQNILDFIESHSGPQSAQFRYVDLPEEVLAPLGEQAPIQGIVLLNRVFGASPKMEPVSEAEVLKTCVLQSFGRSLNAIELIDHLHNMVKDAVCVKLTYSTVKQAQALLQEKFA